MANHETTTLTWEELNQLACATCILRSMLQGETAPAKLNVEKFVANLNSLEGRLVDLMKQEAMRG